MITEKTEKSNVVKNPNAITFVLAFLVSILLLFTSNCGQINKLRKPKDLLSDSIVTVENLKQIQEKLWFYNHKHIVIEGYFMGWGTRDCHFVANFCIPRTRSDWAFRDLNDTCIYITGGLPPNVSLFDRMDRNKLIRMQAIVHKVKGNRMFLEYVNAVMIEEY